MTVSGKKPIALVNYREELSDAFGPLPSSLCDSMLYRDLETVGYKVENFKTVEGIVDPRMYSALFVHAGVDHQKESINFMLIHPEIKSALLIKDPEIRIHISKLADGRRVWSLPHYAEDYLIDFVEISPRDFAMKYRRKITFEKLKANISDF